MLFFLHSQYSTWGQASVPYRPPSYDAQTINASDRWYLKPVYISGICFCLPSLVEQFINAHNSYSGIAHQFGSILGSSNVSKRLEQLTSVYSLQFALLFIACDAGL